MERPDGGRYADHQSFVEVAALVPPNLVREVLDLMLADTRILVVSKSGLLAAECVHVLLTSMWPLTWIHTVILNWSEA